MNVGTAKPSPEELAEVRHHLVNSLSVYDDYSAGKFETDALECILKIFSDHDYAILCGGSGLYVELVCSGADELPVKNEELRSQLNKLFSEKGVTALQEKLLKLDPEFYHEVDLNNPHRLIRAIEVCLVTGKKFSDLRTSRKNKRPFNIIKVGLEDEREKVYQQIDQRVDLMIARNLLGEARSLHDARHFNALRTVGYTELFEFIDGKLSFEEAVKQIKQHTRNYAKRQWTWFRRDQSIRWFKPDNLQEISEFIFSRSGE